MIVGMLMFAVAAQAVDVIDPAEVAPGTTGVCITEMDGGERVEIPLTVLGTVGPWSPDGEIVLVRLEDDRFRHTGIIAGMSGSPVYIGDRLLGALAYGWSFAKDPIGGVTPFSHMEGLAVGSVGVAAAGSGRPSMVEMITAGCDHRLGELLTGWLLPESGGDLRGLPLAVTASTGWNPAAGDWLGEGWRRLGWVSVPGGSSHVDFSGGALEPGSMVAGVLVDGDVVLAAGGTVTEVRGDDVWAFGHPFLGGGGFHLPMARAHVVTVLPSQYSSFKFFSVGETVGSFVNDRSHGIWGRLGSITPMVPVTVTVNDRRFNFRSVRHPGLTPFLAASVAQSSQASKGQLFGDQTVTVRIELTYAGQRPAAYTETIAGGEAPAQASALVAAVVAYLENSSFKIPDLEAIAVEITAEERLRSARLVDVIPERRVVRPGENLAVRLRFRPFQGVDFIRELTIDVPTGTPEGRLDLVVADGASWTLYDLGMRPFEPGSFADELRLIEGLRPSTSVVMALERRQIGVALPGGSVTMPPSLVVQLRGGLGPAIETTDYAVVATTEETMGLPLAGAERIELRVRSERPLGHSEVQ